MAGIGNDLVREARRRAALSQRELAEKAGTTQSAIARIETGRSTPSFDTVLRLVRLCGLDLDVMLVERDDSDWAQARSLLSLPGHERVAFGMRTADTMLAIRGRPPMAPREFTPDKILEVLLRHDVDLVVIGGLAALAHGSPIPTRDVDITPETSRANLARLSDALRELEARIRTDAVDDGLPFDHDAKSLAAAGVWNLVTRFGDLDISMVPNGTLGYPDLVRDASDVAILEVVAPVASLADVIRSKQAANRPKDQRVLPVLREILASRFDRE